MTVFSNWLRPWGEVIGPLHSLQEYEGSLLARIGQIDVLLPKELEARLRELQGQTIGILRTDQDFRISVIAESVPETNATNPIKTFA
ncbi:MAG: hypothetical protein ABR985_22245 [Methanotrichaceae archaeon]